jgi:hypothetical protein
LAGKAILGERVAAAVVRAADFRKRRRVRGMSDPFVEEAQMRFAGILALVRGLQTPCWFDLAEMGRSSAAPVHDRDWRVRCGGG